MAETAANQYESVDFFSDTSIVNDPYPYYRYLRDERGPVWIEPKHGMAIVSGHDEAMTVYRDADTFSNCNSPSGVWPGLPVMPDGDDATELIEEHRKNMPIYGFMATWDPPTHAAYRGLLTGLFTPKRLKENEEFMWRLADETIDEFISRGECEFIKEFAEPFTLLVIADILGVPQEDLPQFREHYEKRQTRFFEDGRSGSDETFGYLEGIFSEYIEDRRRQPRGDVLTHLAQVTFPDGSVPETRILANEGAFLFSAGKETTARTLAFELQYVGEHPEMEERLRNERRLIPAFVEEMLRFESPVKVHFRMARRTTTLGGTRIPAGTTIALMIGAVNHDPKTFDHPEELLIERPNRHEHVAFAKGNHSCLGQPLARAEARVALERIFDRMTDIRISEAHHGPPGERRYEYDPLSLFRGLNELHIQFTPTGS